ncbi:MAG: cell division protein FtsL [Acidobacteria bacterium]|nr:cell division protein FtsL [Acidobacteriota bacterium]
MAVLALGLLALVVHTVFGEHGYLALRRQQQEMDRLQQEVQRLEEENKRLAAEIESLKSDPRAVERVAREQLKMARPGERVITIPETPPTQTEADKGKKP